MTSCSRLVMPLGVELPGREEGRRGKRRREEKEKKEGVNEFIECTFPEVSMTIVRLPRVLNHKWVNCDDASLWITLSVRPDDILTSLRPSICPSVRHSLSTNFSPELIEKSAKEVEGHRFFELWRCLKSR